MFQAEQMSKHPLLLADHVHLPEFRFCDIAFAATLCKLAINFHGPESRGEIGASHIEYPLQYLFFIQEAHRD